MYDGKPKWPQVVVSGGRIVVFSINEQCRPTIREYDTTHEQYEYYQQLKKMQKNKKNFQILDEVFVFFGGNNLI